MSNLSIFVNCDSSDLPVNSSGIDWVEIDESNDSLIITGGSTVVADGEIIAGQSALSQAGVRLTDPRTEIIIDKYLLADNSAGIYKEIDLAGNIDARHVFAFSWDGDTSSEPQLSLHDDDDLDSIDNTSLGGGVASSSWWRGITTTDGLPGVDWVGSRLAGDADGHYLNLNNLNGALTAPKVLYAQIKVIVPSTAQNSGAEVPIIAIRWADVA